MLYCFSSVPIAPPASWDRFPNKLTRESLQQGVTVPCISGRTQTKALSRSTGSLRVARSCPTLCNPTDCSPPGSSVHGILQAILEWVAIPFSRGIFLTQGGTPRTSQPVFPQWLDPQRGRDPLAPSGANTYHLTARFCTSPFLSSRSRSSIFTTLRSLSSSSWIESF